MAVDTAGNLFLADARRSRVRRIGLDGIIDTVVGSSPYRLAGEGGPAVEAVLNTPVSLAVSPDGSVHLLERDNCRVRSIAPDGVIRTIAGNGLCVTSINRATSDQSESAIGIGLGGPTSLTAGSGGNVYLADIRRIRVIAPDGQIRSIVNQIGQPGDSGDVSGPATDARINGPVYGMYLDGDGNLYFSDMQSNRVRKVTPEGVIGTFAGSGPAPGPAVFAGDGGPAIEARLSQPSAITGDAAGNIYILDTGNRRIRKVARDGVITTVPGSELAFVAPGPFGYPGLAADAAGNVYISDQANHRIRRMSPDGTVAAVAGTGAAGWGGDGGEPEKAMLNGPTGLAIDGAGNLYIADTGNHRIRRIGAGGPQ